MKPITKSISRFCAGTWSRLSQSMPTLQAKNSARRRSMNGVMAAMLRCPGIFSCRSRLPPFAYKDNAASIA